MDIFYIVIHKYDRHLFTLKYRTVSGGNQNIKIWTPFLCFFKLMELICQVQTFNQFRKNTNNSYNDYYQYLFSLFR